MAEAVRVKKTKTKGHKSKSKDKESIPAHTKDFEVVDINDAPSTSVEREWSESHECLATSVIPPSSLEQLITYQIPGNEVSSEEGSNIKDTAALGAIDTAESENVSGLADTEITNPIDISIPTCDSHLFSEYSSKIEQCDLNVTDLSGETSEISAVRNFEINSDISSNAASEAVQCPVSGVETVSVETRSGSRESQLDGHLGVILAESFANASAPEHILSTEATVGEIVQSEGSVSHPTQPKIAGNLEKRIPAVAVVHRKLYPSLAAETVEPLRPFTEEQLRTLYYNHELEHIEDYIELFLQKSQQERHEFYEIVRSYYRARNHLSGAELDVETLQKDSRKYQDLSWEVVVEKISVQGYCQDKYKVVGDLVAERAIFKQEVCNQLDRTLKSIQNQIHDDLSLFAYEAQLSRLQVDSYLSRLYSNNLELSSIPPNYPVQALLAHHRDPAVSHQVESLKSCISVLFAFQRKPTKDDVFTKDTRQWLSVLVGTLLRLATLDDHLFLLSHILRCPAGMGKWAVSFVQPVMPPVSIGETSWGGPLLDHFTTMLALILLPIRQREEMLYQMKVSFSAVTEAATEGQWIIVDSDGEEDEDPNNSWHYLQENDIVSLLNQFPLSQIFDHILLVKEQNGDLIYNASQTSETSVLKLFAYSTCLIQLLGRGLQNFTLGRYRQLNKRIGRMIRHIVQYTTDHWVNFRSSYVGLSSATLDRLQLESDMVLQRAVECILSASRLGSWQFLTELPYKSVSISVLWNLFRLMHHGCTKIKSGHLCTDLAAELCKLELTDSGNQAEFHDKLTRLQTSEALFLLNTFANMARARTEADMDFIEFVAREIHEIAYESSHTREFCSKLGRELLSTICVRHPPVISFLLHCTKRNMDKIGMVSHYLYRGLPLHLWHPTEADFSILHHWLIECDIHSAENQLARILVESMNWSYDATGDGLFLAHSLHQHMAALLMDVTSVQLAGKNLGKLFIDGQKQLSPSGKTGDDHQLATWIWSTALRLHLHDRSASLTGSLLRESNDCNGFVDLASSIELQSIVSGLLSENRVSLASYFVLLMTKSGHSKSEFLAEGVQHLSHLVEKSYFIPAIQCIYYITPMFFDCLNYLTSNAKFMQCVQTVLQTDSARKGYFSFDSSRPVAQTFSSMIENQISVATADGKSASEIILFWLRFLTELTNWNKEREIIFVMDNIIRSSYLHPGTFDQVQNLFFDLTKNYTYETGSGFLSSISSWLGSGGRISSLMEQSSNPEFVWFAFVVLVAETRQLEMETNLRKELQNELLQNKSIAVDKAFAKAVSNLKLENNCTTLANLGIYRWAYQAVDTPMDHPLLPLIWQQFMLAYLGRTVTASGLAQRGSIGDRFFVTSTYNSLMKRMKKRLKDSADHYRHLLAKISAAAVPDQEPGTVLSPESQSLYEKLAKLNLTLSFWLDEPRLHDDTLYIPALPEQYQGQLLVGVFQCQTEYWRHFVDEVVIRKEAAVLAKDWSAHLTQSHSSSRSEQGTRATMEHDESVDDLVARLQHNRSEIVAPPTVQIYKSSVPDLNPSLLLDKQNLLYTLRADFQCMVDHAKLYAMRVSKHVDLDCTFIEFLQKLYVNVMTEGVMTVPCRSAFNPTHRCKGPAVITCMYENRRQDEIISRKIQENRASYKQLLIESLLTPPQNLCSSAVRVENAITGLVNLRRTTEVQSTKDQLILVGTALFYVMTSYISDDTKFYPPTRQFFSTCIELLGQEFIRNNPSQSQALLQTILQSPSLVGLLAPNFSPNANSELFVTMYEDMANVPSCQGVDVAFTLLTKFDVSQWLESIRPLLSRRVALIECVFRALCLCGLEPNSSLRLVFQVYRVHLQQLVCYQFPDHYGIILKSLLRGSLDSQICPSVWSDFLDCLDGQQRRNSLEGFVCHERLLATTPCVLPKPQVKECMEFLSSYFFNLRVGSEEAVTFGLYPKWSPYVEGVSHLLSHLSSRYISAEDSVTQTGDDNEQMVANIFRQMTDLFTPWILPLNSNGEVLLPWTLNDMSLGADMVAAWISSVDLLHQTFEPRLPVLSKNALNLLWSQYVASFTMKGLPDHLLRVVHDRLVLLPWIKLFPDLQAVELMVKVIDYSKSCFEFLGNIFTLLDWTSILKFYITHELPEITTRLHVCLFTLLVHLAHETVILENTNLPKILSSDIFDWNFLDGQNYQSVVQWFINVCQPQCVTLEKTANGSQVLTLLKRAAGFYPRTTTGSTTEHPETPVKRCFYVRCIVQLICRSSYLKNVRTEALGINLSNLMTEVEAIVASVSDPQSQHHEAIVLSTEILCLFNNCNPQGSVSIDMLRVSMQWIESSPLSVLLMPLMISACRCLASMNHMVMVVESCIDTHFSIDVSQTDGFGWTRILSVLQVPDLNASDFVKAAVQQGCYLTLYAYVLQKLPLSQNLDDELVQLNQLVDWNTNVKPSAENESKLLLWWLKIIELCQRQIDFGGDFRVVVKSILLLVSALLMLGEDKSTTGLLGAIGLGRRSSLSLRFRLVAKGLAAFLAAQIPSDLSLRLASNAAGFLPCRGSPTSPPHSSSTLSPSQQALQALAHLESLRSNKQYLGFKQHIELVINIVCDRRNSFRDAIPVFAQMASPLFPEFYYLAIIHCVPMR